MVNTEDIPKHKILDSLENNYFKCKLQAYINCANSTLVGLFQHLYNDHGTISPVDIEESEHKMKQEWYLLEPVVGLFDKTEKVFGFSEAATNPIPGNNY